MERMKMKRKMGPMQRAKRTLRKKGVSGVAKSAMNAYRKTGVGRVMGVLNSDAMNPVRTAGRKIGEAATPHVVAGVKATLGKAAKMGKMGRDFFGGKKGTNYRPGREVPAMSEPTDPGYEAPLNEEEVA